MLRCKPSGASFAFVPSGLTRLCCALVFLATVPFTLAAPWRWNGLGGNSNFSTAGNWDVGTTPASDPATDLFFEGTTNTGTALVPLNQNIATPFVLNNIVFTVGAGSFYLGGGAFRFDGGNSNSITQNSSSAQSIANAFSAPSSNGVVTLVLTGTSPGVVTMSGIISSGSGQRDYAMVKTGASTFSLTGMNTYAGGTTISGGTLIVNSAASLGNNSGGLTMNAGTLEVASSFSTSRAITLNSAASTFLIDPSQTYTVTSGITGTGALNKTGTGTMVLSGANTYSGGTIVSAGTLRLGAADRLLNTGAVTISGGTFDLQTFSETVGVITLSSGSIVGTGTLTGSAYAFEAGTVSPSLGGTGALTKTTAGTLTLSGANTYSGGTTIQGGTVVINSSANLGNVAGALTINGGTLEIATGFTTARAISLGDLASTFQIDPGVTYTVSSSISGTGALNKTGSGTMALSGANTYSGGTVVSAGTLRVNANERIANTSDLTVAGGTFNVQAFSETVANVTLSSGSITGTGTLTGSTFTLQSGNATAILAGSGATMTKTTAGTVTLTGANTFTGATTINGGTLTASSSSGSALGGTSGVTVNSGGTLLLGADNQINNAATITLAGGTLDKGNFSEGSAASPGMGALTLTASGSQIDFGNGTVGILTFASFTPGSFTLSILNWTGTVGTEGSGTTDRLIFASSQGANLNSFAFDGYAGATELDLENGYYEITPVSAVPEPSTYIAAVFALATIGFQQARRFRRTLKRA
jgi:fibronectin-binding autotransporter adhesin